MRIEIRIEKVMNLVWPAKIWHSNVAYVRSVSAIITRGAKLLNADWLRQRAFFLIHEDTFGNQEGMITWCWLVIGCLGTKHYCRWNFFDTIAFRFAEADGALIEELKHGIQNKSTKRSTVYWTGVFKQWAVTRGKTEEIESYEVSQLNEALKNVALYVINK